METPGQTVAGSYSATPGKNKLLVSNPWSKRKGIEKFPFQKRFAPVVKKKVSKENQAALKKPPGPR